MTLISKAPSPEAQAALQALQNAVSKCLARKQKLGEYAVIWQNSQPVCIGVDAPKAGE